MSTTAFVSTFPGRLLSVVRPATTVLPRRALHRAPVITHRSRIRASASSSEPFRLAPSDFAFLWQECRHCFYLKVHGQRYRPRAPFPSVFGTIDLAMKRHFRGLRTTDVLPDMPPGVFLCEDEDAWVESMPHIPSSESRGIFVRGMVDAVARLDDGSLAIIDFKTSGISKTTAETYARQLHAYALALERPSPRSELAQAQVSHLGLVVYSPTAFDTPVTEEGLTAAALTGALTYVPIERDNEKFSTFLADVAAVLDAPEPPPPPPPGPRARRNVKTSCPYCQFLHEGLQHRS